MSLVTTKQPALPTAGLPAAYKSDVVLFNRWLRGRAISADSLSAYFRELAKTLRASTLNRKKSALKKAIASARGGALTVSEHAQLSSVFTQIKPATVEKAVHEHEILSRDELSELLKTAGEKTSALVAALYESASRVSELLSLRLADCTVRGENVYCLIRRGKGRKERTAFMSKKTFMALKKAYGGKIYLVERSGEQLSRFTIATMIKRAGAHVGRPDLHPHTLRHTKASHLLKAGMSLPAVSAYCGHSDPATTAKYYLHDKPTAEAVLSL